MRFLRDEQKGSYWRKTISGTWPWPRLDQLQNLKVHLLVTMITAYKSYKRSSMHSWDTNENLKMAGRTDGRPKTNISTTQRCYFIRVQMWMAGSHLSPSTTSKILGHPSLSSCFRNVTWVVEYLHDMHYNSHARNSISINCIQHCLWNSLKQILWTLKTIRNSRSKHTT